MIANAEDFPGDFVPLHSGIVQTAPETRNWDGRPARGMKGPLKFSPADRRVHAWAYAPPDGVGPCGFDGRVLRLCVHQRSGRCPNSAAWRSGWTGFFPARTRWLPDTVPGAPPRVGEETLLVCAPRDRGWGVRQDQRALPPVQPVGHQLSRVLPGARRGALYLFSSEAISATSSPAPRRWGSSSSSCPATGM